MNEDTSDTLQRAVALHGNGQPQRAAELYAEVLRNQPDHPDALHLLGVAETQLGRPRSGIDWIRKSLAVNPHQPAAIANEGNALLALNEFVPALKTYDQALRISPDYWLAVYGRGNALSALRRWAEALASFERALELKPDFLAALIARGGMLQKLERPAEALATYDRAIELAPDCADAFLERGHLLSERKQTAAAVAAYDRALELQPTLAGAWFSRGLALSLQARFSDAAASLRRALELDPHYPYALGPSLHAQLQVCDWRGYAASASALEAAVERNEPVDFPFSFLAISDSPMLQLQCSRRFAALQANAPSAAPGSDAGLGVCASAPSANERIRIAYVSADFLEHPTAYLMAGLFEKHDRRRFEIIGVSLRDDAQSPTARRIHRAFDRLVAAQARPDAQLARQLREMHIDIAVDLMGYTGEHRGGMFTHRPAPIQVNYLGFPATTGSQYIDYLIGDEFLIPPAHRAAYSESIAYLPDCFQVNDDRRVAAPPPTRALMGLPAAGIVWCSLHSSYKLNPPLFDVWCRLLLAVPDSVLWLLGNNPLLEENLGREALARGVASGRLVFAKGLPYPEHLARLSLADVCLDTAPFNGGATTSDALWAGVPVVTCAGQAFAARMSGSMLKAVGFPELIATSLPEYEQFALQLVRTPGRLAEVRAALADNRRSAPLFDTDRFRRHVEAAYIEMVRRHRLGLPPATFCVPAEAMATRPNRP